MMLYSNRRRRISRCFWAEPLERRLLLASVPDGFTDTEVVSGLQSPTAMTIAPDGRIFVAGQKGVLSVVQNDQVSTVLTIPNVNSNDERGFGGITVDPNFASNGWVYVYYTAIEPEHNRLARYTIDQNNQPVGGQVVILDLPDSRGAIYHMGGALHFGPDGKLFVAVGDHLDSSAAQRLDNVFGKILRINSDGSIPSDNPFFGQTSGINRAIWAMGLRNPFTFAFDPISGEMFINDVGQVTWEEVNRGQAGANYGWPLSEGPDNTDGFTAPIFWYDHHEGRCAITGATFYRPETANFPASYVGQYFFGELCVGTISRLDPNQPSSSTQFARGLSFPVDIDVASDGSMYYLQRGMEINTGVLGRITFVGTGAPIIVDQPQSQSAVRGSSVTFSVTASGAPPLAFQWHHNGKPIDGATEASFTIDDVQNENVGQYRVTISNDLGSITSAAANLSLVEAGSAPSATILTPAAGTKFRGGQTFSFSGSATDAEDGELDASRFSWRVDYHTGSVVRPFVPQITGVKSGSLTIPDETPFKEANVFYRVVLMVTDSGGASTTITRDLTPLVARIILRSTLPDATLFIDGQPKSIPYSTDGVVGIRRTIGAGSTRVVEGVTYVFDGWSDGGEMTHQISTPKVETTYTAKWRAVPALTTKGLTQTVYNNRDRTGTVVISNIRNIDFDWGDGSPDPNIARDTFFIRWRGKVQPEFSETYTFYARANDGVRLFVNGQLLIDQWNDSEGAELSGSIPLEAGVKYDLRFDYFENRGTALAQLLWSSPSTPKQVIQRNKLFAPIVPSALLPTADTYVQGGSASDQNFGNRSLLLTKSASNERYIRESYLKFDITSLASISSAKLRVFGRLSDVVDTNIITALYAAPKAKWGERSITFDNRPAASAQALAAATVSNNTAQWYEFDITGFLQQEKAAGHSIVTFVLRNLDTSTTYTRFHSRHAGTNLPQIQVWA